MSDLEGANDTMGGLDDTLYNLGPTVEQIGRDLALTITVLR